MSKRVIVVDLSLLQSRVKKDPEGYKDEFLKKYQHYQTLYEILKLKPTEESDEFDGLVKFLSQVATCYPVELKELPNQIVDLLETNANIISAELRVTLVQALILLRNRNLLSPTSLLSLFFKLFRCKDKKLRVLLHNHIVGDIKRCNQKKKNDNLNKTLQNFMYTMLQDESSVAPRQSLSVMIELYRRKIWNNRKTVNVIGLGIFSQDQKIVSKVLNFFLCPPKVDPDKEDENVDINSKLTKKKKAALKKFDHIAQKRTKKRDRKLKEALHKIKTERKRHNNEERDEAKQYNFEALHLINDPQGYGEKIFNALKTCKFGFEFKLRMMSLISRLICTHNLIIEAFYSYLQKYAQPHQQHITQILAILGQSCHSLVSPDIIEPVMMSLINNFVTDRRPNEVIAIGLNTVREICMRCPLVMNAGLLKDLVQYRKAKDKSVMMAARSLITLFRLINPSLLPKKERGKILQDQLQNIKPLQFGEEAYSTIPGMDLLNEELSDEMDSQVEISVDEWEEVSDEENMDEENKNKNEENDNMNEENNSDNKKKIKENINQDDDEEEIDENEENIDEENINEENIDEENIDEELSGDYIEVDENASDFGESETTEFNSTKEESSNINNLDMSKYILSQEDLEKMRRIQQRKIAKDPTNSTIPLKRKLEELYDFELDTETILGYQKKRKLNKEEKLESVIDGRPEFEKKKKEDFKSKTNHEKKKTKPYNMLRQKAMKKMTLSNSQKKGKHARHVHKNKVKNSHRKWAS